MPDRSHLQEAPREPHELSKDPFARAIAKGVAPFPSGLPEETALQLALGVQEHRRKKLLQYLARQIAIDLFQRPPAGASRRKRC